MKVINNKVIGLYAMLLFAFLYRIISMSTDFISYSNLINTIIWIIILIYCLYIKRYMYSRIDNKNGKVQTIFIITTMYLIIEFLLGLEVGYQKSPYSHKILSLFTNTLYFIIPLLIQEIARYILVLHTRRKKYIYLTLIVLLFTLLNLNYMGFSSNFNSFETGFKYVCSTIIPLISKNIILCYLCYVSSYAGSIMYQILMLSYQIYLPILPNLNWFTQSIFGLIFPIVVYIVMHYEIIKTSRQVTRKEIEVSNPLSYIPIGIFGVVMIGFVLGWFKYQPIAIMSNSMSPSFERGWVVISQKVDEEEAEDIKEGTVIRFKTEGVYTVHRILEKTTTKDGDVVYITKGDANNAPDVKPVAPSQIDGIVKYKIPYLGYPSVWFSELLG